MKINTLLFLGIGLSALSSFAVNKKDPNLNLSNSTTGAYVERVTLTNGGPIDCRCEQNRSNPRINAPTAWEPIPAPSPSSGSELGTN
jgi:hypothetical protein